HRPGGRSAVRLGVATASGFGAPMKRRCVPSHVVTQRTRPTESSVNCDSSMIRTDGPHGAARGVPESSRRVGMKQASGLSVGAIGLAILVIAMDFAVIRAAFLSPGSGGWPEPRRPLLPGMLAARFLKPRPDEWAVFAFYLLPMIDALLIGAYRLRRRGDHTVGTVGYVIAGSVATLAVFTSCLIWPGTAIGMLTPSSRPIALASFHGLERLFGKVAWPNHALEWTYAVIFAVLIPIAFFCIPPLLVALIGGWVARHCNVAGPSLPGLPPTTPPGTISLKQS